MIFMFQLVNSIQKAVKDESQKFFLFWKKNDFRKNGSKELSSLIMYLHKQIGDVEVRKMTEESI